MGAKRKQAVEPEARPASTTTASKKQSTHSTTQLPTPTNRPADASSSKGTALRSRAEIQADYFKKICNKNAGAKGRKASTGLTSEDRIANKNLTHVLMQADNTGSPVVKKH